MCGIVGYIGSNPAKDFLINGLKKLEYRGYDSSGIILFNRKAYLKKCKGKIAALEKTLIEPRRIKNAFYTIIVKSNKNMIFIFSKFNI